MKLFTKHIVILVTALVLMVGSFATGVMTTINFLPDEYKANIFSNNNNSETIVQEGVDMTAFWKTWNKIEELYIGDMPTKEEKAWGAIQGLVSSLDDPYSVFFPPRESERFESGIRGDFEGVGMEIEIRDKILTVVTPLKDTPAEAAGIQPGDKIIKIDDTTTVDMLIGDAVDLIRGPKDTVVVLSVVRDGVIAPIEISVTRQKINIPVLEIDKIAEEGVFIIKLYSFSAKSENRFKDAIKEFVRLVDSENYNKLIIDVRNNPGGYLESAVGIASWFLPAGKVVVKEDFGEKGEGKVFRSRGYDILKNKDVSIAVLINKGSASASEILAGALSLHGTAVLVGEKTFGKGSVQQLIDITENTSLKITTAQWLLVDDSVIAGEGITPDYETPLTIEQFKEGIDPQLEKAIEVLRDS